MNLQSRTAVSAPVVPSIDDAVLQTIRDHAMFKPGDMVYVAVSGGLDSTSLLDFLLRHAQALKIRIGIIHINHSLRGDESNKDEQFVSQLAKSHNLPFLTACINVRMIAHNERLSLEDAARKARYRTIVGLAKKEGAVKVALAHTKDDQVETVLMRIIRGTGLKGFRAIHPTFTADTITFVRPFLEISRDDIVKYGKQHAIQFRQDLSNKSFAFFRNKVRHELIRLLEQEYNPKVKEAVIRMSETVHDDYEYLQQLTDVEYARILKKETEDLVSLRKDDFMKMHTALQYRILSRAIAKLHPHFTLHYKKWMLFRQSLMQRGKCSEVLTDNLMVSAQHHELVVERQKRPAGYEYFFHAEGSLFIKEAGVTITVKEMERRPEHGVHHDQFEREYVDLDSVAYPLTVRNWRSGDRLRPLGMQKDKKLHDVFIDRKIPRYRRDQVPMIVARGKIVWVYLAGISDFVKLTPETKRVLEISFQTHEQQGGVT